MSNQSRPERNPWMRYVPDDKSPWNLRRVVHLHRRAGFAATWSEIQRDLRDGPDLSISRLLSASSRTDGVPSDFESTSGLLGRSAVAASDISRLKAWWIYRMQVGPDPLGERLTLCWHNHFATSAVKAGLAVYRQNELFRKFARAPFGELLSAVVHDPAVLIWLDAQTNVKGEPNENLARELMELFTLGIGHFTESDVKEVARALTGWAVHEGNFHFSQKDHDTETKTILGRTGKWNGDDLLSILIEHPATANRVAARLCELFMGEGAITTKSVESLATILRDNKLDIGAAVRTILRSEEFFSDANIGNRVLGPVEFVVGTARMLELFDPLPNPLIMAEYAATLGQDLFFPPNVGGWTGGRAWITTRSAIGRHNYASALMHGQPVGRPPFNALRFAEKQIADSGTNAFIDFFGQLLTGRTPGMAWRERIAGSLLQNPPISEETVRQLIVVMLASPEAQLC